jgi:hypothetical protein
MRMLPSQKIGKAAACMALAPSESKYSQLERVPAKHGADQVARNGYAAEASVQWAFQPVRAWAGLTHGPSLMAARAE